ncbi:hypothetical protein AVEN_127227-1, partial [Araneus ventricosus]
DADFAKNVDAAGESSLFSLVHKDEVRYLSATKLSDTVQKGTIVRPTIRAWYTPFMETGRVLHKQVAVAHPFQTPALLWGLWSNPEYLVETMVPF